MRKSNGETDIMDEIIKETEAAGAAEVSEEAAKAEEAETLEEVSEKAERDGDTHKVQEAVPDDKGAGKVKTETPPISYLIRVLCGGYLLYLSFQLFNGDGAGKPVVLAAAALFVLAGLFLIIISIKGLLKKKDPDKPEN